MKANHKAEIAKLLGEVKFSEKKLDKIKAEKEKQREFVKPSADDLPKEWDSKNSGFVAEFGVKPNKNFER